MEEISEHVGGKIRTYRKMKKLTIQQLADRINKSRATVSKYENGEITIDIQTLFEVSEALEVSLVQLMDYHPHREEEVTAVSVDYNGQSPFFKADKLYYYFYDGRYQRLKAGIIDVHKNSIDEDGCYEASMSIHSTTPTGRSSEIYYVGSVLYSDMLIRFSFVNQHNKLEQDLLYIFNPLERRDYTEGLLCGISSADLMPCAFKCIVALTPIDNYEELQNRLMLTKKELRRFQNINMFIVDNQG